MGWDHGLGSWAEVLVAILFVRCFWHTHVLVTVMITLPHLSCAEKKQFGPTNVPARGWSSHDGRCGYARRGIRQLADTPPGPLSK